VPRSQVTDIEAELAAWSSREAIATHELSLSFSARYRRVIAVAKVVPGQVVQPQDMLFQSSTEALWVERWSTARSTRLRLPSDGGWDERPNHAACLRVSARACSTRRRSSTSHLGAPPTSASAPVTVVAKSGRAITGIIVPRTRWCAAAMRTIVRLHVEADDSSEAVRTQPFDATRGLPPPA